MRRAFDARLARRTNRLPANHRRPYWRRPAPRAEPAAVGPDIRDRRLAQVEAVLFAAEEPLAARRIATLAELADAAEARRLVERLRDLLYAEGSAFRVEEIAGGYQLLTRPEFHPWLVRLRQTAGEPKLSGALLETLAIVAYRQPIMRADLEAIRGVQSGDILRSLMERGLVRIAGRHDSLGRPVLYGTTKKFLATFGLRDLRDLPPVGG
jgi:segregation and condensation protein B